jgi:enoyl-CoA hydratase/carnithine racemase
VGKANTMEFLTARELIGSKEALEIGLLNDIFPDETFGEEILEVAKKNSQKNLPDVQEVLDSVIHGIDENLEDVMVMKITDFSPFNSYMGI